MSLRRQSATRAGTMPFYGKSVCLGICKQDVLFVCGYHASVSEDATRFVMLIFDHRHKRNLYASLGKYALSGTKLCGSPIYYDQSRVCPFRMCESALKDFSQGSWVVVGHGVDLKFTIYNIKT